MVQVPLVLARSMPPRSTTHGAAATPRWSRIIVIEDNSARAQRRMLVGVTPQRPRAQVTIRVHRIRATEVKVLAERSYAPGKLVGGPRRGGRAAVALELLDRLRLRRKGTVVVAGPAYGCNRWFTAGLLKRGFDFVVEVRPSTRIPGAGNGSAKPPGELLPHGEWRRLKISAPGASAQIMFTAADLPEVPLPNQAIGRLFVGQTGAIDGVHRGTIFALTSVRRASLKQLVEAIGWARWVRPAVRRHERLDGTGRKGGAKSENGARGNAVNLAVRANIMLARRQDQSAGWNQTHLPLSGARSRGAFVSQTEVNVAELFAGAGGMGLGFLLAARGGRRYRLIFSAEVNPIHVATLKQNHRTFTSLQRGRPDVVPARVHPIDLRASASLDLIASQCREEGGIHLLIGGPPCQGFSNANRNSWHSENPHNRLVEVFIRYVEALQPPAFLMENVQGILWTPRNGVPSRTLSVVDLLARRLESAGYLVFPKLLDAVWYGVPQYRSRFFLLGLRKDLGYQGHDFGSFGPFPLPTHGPGTGRPYVTVRDAISDLPAVGNGHGQQQMPYEGPSAEVLKRNSFLALMRTGARKGMILDHITSRHADYVIERYRKIPPGGNWEDIAAMLTNYTDAERTHSNIYRRLTWEEPSITIGHYRKSMLVHPSQHRGLSLREASRLQSFPDWFCFSGTPDGRKGGLVHKQQQLANAVCPLVTKALAEFILQL